jgi:outer membrane receptor protein involved in Fe transport
MKRVAESYSGFVVDRRTNPGSSPSLHDSSKEIISAPSTRSFQQNTPFVHSSRPYPVSRRSCVLGRVSRSVDFLLQVRKYHTMTKTLITVSLLCSFFFTLAFAGTTGKIAGRLVDAANHQPVVGANVMLVNTTLGASSDMDGYFYVINIPPGNYDVRVSCIGYRGVLEKSVSVSVDRTTALDFVLTPATVDMGAVEIVAQRQVIVRDLTSTEQKVTAAEIANLPVENVGDLLQLQAGITTDASGHLHMRGGRESELQYYVDGMPASNPFNGQNAFGDMQNGNIQEMQVISGTFNAEYGDAMSGIVNIITKDGGETMDFSLNAYAGDFVTANKSTFPDIGTINPFSQKYVEAALGGPLSLFGQQLNYRISGRYRNEEGWLYGRRHYLTSDTADLSEPSAADWKIQHSGNDAYVPMNPSQAFSGMARLSYHPMDNLKVMYSLIADKSQSKSYLHADFLTPDFEPTHYTTSINNLFVVTHTLNASSFQELKLTYETFENQIHVQENPFDPVYQQGIPRVRNNLADVFVIGGVDPNLQDRQSATAALRYEFTSQMNRFHLVKFGTEVRTYDIEENQYQVRRDEASNWQLVVDPVTSVTHNYYRKRPIQGAAFAQDKIEVEDFIMNIGVRFDYFNARSKVPRDMGDPHNDNVISHPQLSVDEAYVDATPKMQVSPRIGLAFPISENGNIHASYGHFFQIPELQRLYENPEFEIQQGSFVSFLGNADLDAQRTTSYEIGLQQRMAENLVLDATCFYKDYRNLLGTTLYSTFDGSYYGAYSNKDYGYVWGMTLALSILQTRMFSANLDYTYQVAEGNGSDPTQAFINAGRGDESAKSLIPLNWDQRNVLNAVLMIDGATWGIRSISHYATGVPYDAVTTFDPNRNIQLMNQGRRRSEFNMDIRFYQHLSFDVFKTTLFVSVENVFDAERIDYKPEISSVALSTHQPLDFLNSLYDYRYDPASQPRPRLVKMGIQVDL